MLKAFRKVTIVIRESGVIFQDSALYLEIVDAARERIGKRLEDKERKRLAVVVLALDAIALAAGLFEADLRVLIGMGERVGKESEQAGGADVVKRGSHQDGKDFFGDNGFSNGGNEVVDGDGAFAEKLFHHFVVAFGDHFDEFFVSFLRVFSKSGGDFFAGAQFFSFLGLFVCFSVPTIHQTAEYFFPSAGRLEGGYYTVEDFLSRFSL